MDWAQYFEMMRDWKQLPAYKAEPRIDSLIGYYLPAIVAEDCHEEIVGIIPELPIRLATVKPQHEGTSYADKSYKVDFYLPARSGKHYFVEFKTDSGSRREEQDQYLEESKAVGMGAIVHGICRIASVSSYKKKYGHLIEKLKTLHLLNEQGQYAGSKGEIEIVYVQPRRKDEDSGTVIDFAWMSQWLTKRRDAGEYEAELAKALNHWATD